MEVYQVLQAIAGFSPETVFEEPKSMLASYGPFKGLTSFSHSSPNNLPPYPRTNLHMDFSE